MLIKNVLSWQLKESQSTPETIYKQRRDIVKKLGIAAAITPFASNAQAGLFDVFSQKKDSAPEVDPRQDLKGIASPLSSQGLELTPESKVLTYNNFYEFGASKGQPSELSKGFKTRPWTI